MHVWESLSHLWAGQTPGAAPDDYEVVIVDLILRAQQLLQHTVSVGLSGWNDETQHVKINNWIQIINNLM